MIGEGISHIICSHMESSTLYKKIHAKTGADQGLEDASLQVISITNLFLLLQAP